MTGDPKRPAGDTKRMVDRAFIDEVLRKAHGTFGDGFFPPMHEGNEYNTSAPSGMELVQAIKKALGPQVAVDYANDAGKPRLESSPDWYYGQKFHSIVNPDAAPVDSTVADHAARAAMLRKMSLSDTLSDAQKGEASRFAQGLMGVMRRPLTVPSVKPDATRVKSIGGPKR